MKHSKKPSRKTSQFSSRLYEKISRQIIAFVKQEMTSPEGAFYSAIDADSEGVEGKYYVWDDDEIFSVLGEELGELYTSVYNITPQGNFEGKNIPNQLENRRENLVQENNLMLNLFDDKLEKARKLLLGAREERTYPHVDDKILTSWNGLMIAALAKAGQVFQDESYTQSAEKAMRFIEGNLFRESRLMARYRKGETKYNGYIDDYANLVWAYIELYQTTFSTSYLKKGREILDDMIALFWDEKGGGFYFSGNDSETLISREKEIYDGALPSGNSVAAVMLTRMGYLTGEIKYLDKAEEMYYTFYEAMKGYAVASAFFIQSLLLTENPTKEVVILGAKNDPETEKVLAALDGKFLPDVSIVAAENTEQLSEVAPFTAAYKQIDQKTTLYVCENFACQQPTTDVEWAIAMIISE